MITKYAKELGERLVHYENRVKEINELPSYQIIRCRTILPRKFKAKGEQSPYQGLGGVLDSNLLVSFNDR